MNQIKKYPFLLDFSLGMALLLSILMIRIVLSFDYFFNIGMDPMFFFSNLFNFWTYFSCNYNSNVWEKQKSSTINSHTIAYLWIIMSNI